MDPQQQQQFASMATGIGIAVLLVYLVVYIFLIFLFWRIFTKAGMAGALGLIALFPGLGWLICMCILAFSQWRVAPVAPGYDTLAYPPPSYPPATYPPSEPPAQL